MRALALLLMLGFMSCKQSSPIDIQGHRGCRGLSPENTLPAFKKAIELGVHTIELDVVITKDNQVIVSHEPYMNSEICLDTLGSPITKEEGRAINLYQLTYDEIKQFDCGSKQHSLYKEQLNEAAYKPLLSEVIELAEGLNDEIKYNIELKTHPSVYGKFTPFPEEFVALVMTELTNYGILQRTNLQSFDVNTIEQIKKHPTTVEIALLVDGSEDIRSKISQLSFKPDIISPSFRLLDQKFVQELQAENYQVIPWTVNDPKDLQQMIDFKVDGIITDYPDRLIALMHK